MNIQFRRPLVSILATAGLFMSMLFTSGCGNSNPIMPVTNKVTDVYVAGYQTHLSDSYSSAKYWKNSTEVVLGTNDLSSQAYGIAVSGSDVYLAGRSFRGSNDIACYWKNGVEVDLTDGSTEAEADSIFVQGNDVYVSGRENFAAKYWKNGTPVMLNGNAVVGSISVSGSDVYVAGWKYGNVQIDPTHWVDYPIALYWKNGVETDLSDGRISAQASSVFIYGTDVYAAGSSSSATYATDNIPTYWKNGTPVQLMPAGSFAWANGIWTDGTNVYTTGVDDLFNRIGSASYWKNNAQTELGTSTSRSDGSQIAVDGSDVYISGSLSVNGGLTRAGYWKNGSRVDVSGDSASATATGIVVVTH